MRAFNELLELLLLILKRKAIAEDWNLNDYQLNWKSHERSPSCLTHSDELRLARVGRNEYRRFFSFAIISSLIFFFRRRWLYHVWGFSARSQFGRKKNLRNFVMMWNWAIARDTSMKKLRIWRRKFASELESRSWMKALRINWIISANFEFFCEANESGNKLTNNRDVLSPKNILVSFIETHQSLSWKYFLIPFRWQQNKSLATSVLNSL